MRCCSEHPYVFCTKKSCLERRAKCWSKSDLLRHSSWRISEPKFERHLSASLEDKMSIAMPPSRTKMTPSIHRVAMCDCRSGGGGTTAAAVGAIPWLSLKMMTNDVCVSSFVHAAFVMPLSVGGRHWHRHVSLRKRTYIVAAFCHLLGRIDFLFITVNGKMSSQL